VRIANNAGRGINVTPPAGAQANNCDIYENETAGSNYGFYNNLTGVTASLARARPRPGRTRAAGR
jgi:hypothetical protein